MSNTDHHHYEVINEGKVSVREKQDNMNSGQRNSKEKTSVELKTDRIDNCCPEEQKEITEETKFFEGSAESTSNKAWPCGQR